jgi:hypothetical protein
MDVSCAQFEICNRDLQQALAKFRSNFRQATSDKLNREAWPFHPLASPLLGLQQNLLGLLSHNLCPFPLASRLFVACMHATRWTALSPGGMEAGD